MIPPKKVLFERNNNKCHHIEPALRVPRSKKAHLKQANNFEQDIYGNQSEQSAEP